LYGASAKASARKSLELFLLGSIGLMLMTEKATGRL
jgi:hypothetical protein